MTITPIQVPININDRFKVIKDYSTARDLGSIGSWTSLQTFTIQAGTMSSTNIVDINAIVGGFIYQDRVLETRVVISGTNYNEKNIPLSVGGVSYAAFSVNAGGILTNLNNDSDIVIELQCRFTTSNSSNRAMYSGGDLRIIDLG